MALLDVVRAAQRTLDRRPYAPRHVCDGGARRDEAAAVADRPKAICLHLVRTRQMQCFHPATEGPHRLGRHETRGVAVATLVVTPVVDGKVEGTEYGGRVPEEPALVGAGKVVNGGDLLGELVLVGSL
eukprot:CAMPEP_0183338368 /NCGR_PEP_ID=MMETSP0164_2-20130417/5691_1 /TAXON_ID=221442 /ORGANISM="Coccolithus pelagicus ssp braarudi, Strain PLY182g" /LENGTH=127 /DNA_ID=CAMNT_0025508211 /DNA_START=456 /DNA_END=839 /DNA_ORIENTATION=-